MGEIQKVIDTFNRAQRLKVLQFLRTIDAKIVENADGCRINLDKLTSAEAVALKAFIDTVVEVLDPKHRI